MSSNDDDYRDDPDFDLEALQQMVSSLTGRPFDPARLSGPMLVAYRRLIVRAVRSPYPPHKEMRDTFEEMRVAAPLLRLGQVPQPGVRILAPSFSGKSVGARDYVAEVKKRFGEDSRSVVYVKLDSDGSVGSLASDILRGLGEPKPGSLTPDKRWARARNSLKERKVDLLILDEFQRAGRRLTVHPVIAKKILDIMDDSDCAVAFVGKLKAKDIFRTTEDLGNRLDSPVSIGRLKWIIHEQQFIEFADSFDQALVDADVIRSKAGLADPALAKLLLEASNGLIGQFSRIIETAVIGITRDGHYSISHSDLVDAVSDWSIRNERIDRNPLERGDDAVGSTSTTDDERGAGDDDSYDVEEEDADD